MSGCCFTSLSSIVWYSIHLYVIMFVSDLLEVGGFLRVLWFPPAINWPPRDIWNTVETDVKHHNHYSICRSLQNFEKLLFRWYRRNITPIADTISLKCIYYLFWAGILYTFKLHVFLSDDKDKTYLLVSNLPLYEESE